MPIQSLMNDNSPRWKETTHFLKLSTTWSTIGQAVRLRARACLLHKGQTLPLLKHCTSIAIHKPNQPEINPQ